MPLAWDRDSLCKRSATFALDTHTLRTHTPSVVIDGVFIFSFWLFSAASLLPQGDIFSGMSDGILSRAEALAAVDIGKHQNNHPQMATQLKHDVMYHHGMGAPPQRPLQVRTLCEKWRDGGEFSMFLCYSMFLCLIVYNNAITVFNFSLKVF